MKTNSHSARFSALVIAITATLVTQSIRASSEGDIVFTEISSSVLNVTLNGSSSGITVQNTSTDHWTVTFSQDTGRLDVVSWAEPENSNDVNRVQFDSGTQATVVSDTSFTGGLGILPNGFQVLTPSLQFNDNAATAEGHGVPDTGSTLGLLTIALAALFGASRLRSIRLA